MKNTAQNPVKEVKAKDATSRLLRGFATAVCLVVRKTIGFLTDEEIFQLAFLMKSNAEDGIVKQFAQGNGDVSFRLKLTLSVISSGRDYEEKLRSGRTVSHAEEKAYSSWMRYCGRATGILNKMREANSSDPEITNGCVLKHFENSAPAEFQESVPGTGLTRSKEDIRKKMESHSKRLLAMLIASKADQRVVNVVVSAMELALNECTEKSEIKNANATNEAFGRYLEKAS